MKFKSLIFIVLAASMTCTDIYAENNRPIDIALWENGPLEKNDDEGKTYDENVRIYRPSIKVFLPEGKIQDEPSSCAREEDMPFWPTTTKDMPMPTTSNIKHRPHCPQIPHAARKPQSPHVRCLRGHAGRKIPCCRMEDKPR